MMGEPLDIETITNRIAETDMFDKFLAEYLDDNRKRLLKSPDQSKTPAPASPAAPAEPAAAPQASNPETPPANG